MTYNSKSKTMSTRIDPAALAVLEWHARLSGVPLRRWLRELLEERAESISKEFDLDLTQALPPVVPPATIAAALDAEDQRPDLDPRVVFVDRLAAALDMPAEEVDRHIVAEPDGSLSALIDGTTFTDRPITTTPESHHP
jgi:hypothetical protein